LNGSSHVASMLSLFCVWTSKNPLSKKNDLKRPTVFVNLSGDINCVISFSFFVSQKKFAQKIELILSSNYLSLCVSTVPFSPQCGQWKVNLSIHNLSSIVAYVNQLLHFVQVKCQIISLTALNMQIFI